MPTGHSSGGGSSHGGSFSGGTPSGGGMHHAPMPYGRGVVIINNRPYRMGGKASAGFFISLFLAFIFIFTAFGGGIIMANANSTKREIEYDFINYQDVVTTAKKHQEDRIVEGEIKSIEPGYGRFRIIYEFEYKGEQVEGYSFYVYTQEKLNQLGYGVAEEIEIALDLSYEVQGEPDSIPVDFVQFKTTDDGEYLKANKQFKIGVGMLAGGIILTVVTGVVCTVVKRKFAKPYEESAGGSTAVDGEKESKKDSYEDEPTYCEYCGARLKKGDDKCPECGARNRK